MVKFEGSLWENNTNNISQTILRKKEKPEGSILGHLTEFRTKIGPLAIFTPPDPFYPTAFELVYKKK